MTSIVRWEPFTGVTRLERLMDRFFDDRLFHEHHVRPRALMGWFGDGGELAVDMYETADSVVVKAALPGVKLDEVDISVTGDILTIKGERKAEQDISDEAYVCREQSYGAFSRSVVLPSSLMTDKAAATFENGVLTLTIPKAEAIKPKKIEVKAKHSIEGKK